MPVTIVTQLCKYTKNHCIVQVRQVNCTVWKSQLNNNKKFNEFESLKMQVALPTFSFSLPHTTLIQYFFVELRQVSLKKYNKWFLL